MILIQTTVFFAIFLQFSCINADLTTFRVREQIDDLFADLSHWGEIIDAGDATNTFALLRQMATFKQTIDILFDYYANISFNKDPQFASKVHQYMRRIRVALTAVQKTLSQFQPDVSHRDLSHHCVDHLLETTFRVYRSITSPLREYASTIGGSHRRNQPTMDDVTRRPVTAEISARLREVQLAASAAQYGALSFSMAPDFPDIDPNIFVTWQSQKIDNMHLYRDSNQSEVYDNITDAARQRADNSIASKNDHPFVIYAQNEFTIQLHRYSNRLNRRCHQFFDRLAQIRPMLGTVGGDKLHQHIDTVQETIITIVQYISRLTPAAVSTRLCPLTLNTGLRTIVLIVRQLMIDSKNFLQKTATSSQSPEATQDLHRTLVQVSEIVSFPLFAIKRLVDYLNAERTVAAIDLNAHIARTLHSLVDSFQPLDVVDFGPWKADAEHTYTTSLDDVLRKFRTMPDDLDVVPQELHNIRQKVLRVQRSVQYIQGNVVELGHNANGGQLRQAATHVRDIVELLKNLPYVDRLKGLPDLCLGLADKTDGDRKYQTNGAFGHVAANVQEITRVIRQFLIDNSALDSSNN